MTHPTTQRAIWKPAWFELDQELIIGQHQRFWFFPLPSTDSGIEAEDDGQLIFFNQLPSQSDSCVRTARILELYHANLGYLSKIETDGLDYLFVPIEGNEIVVNAEEEPGRVYGGECEIDDWTVIVTLSDVSGPVADFA